MKKTEKILTSISLIIIINIGILIFPKIANKLKIKQIETQNKEAIKKAQSYDFKPTINKNNIIKENAYLNAQFICQAPLETAENWRINEESCEEAALLQAYIYEKREFKTKEESNQTIIDMIEWQEKNFGSHHDMFATEFKKFASKYYKIDETKIIIKENATLEDIKKEISQNHPVIAGVDSTKLNNPYYEYEGYHMLLIKGYTKNKIITNDNGTRRGEDFSYSTEDFMNALKNSEGTIITLHL